MSSGRALSLLQHSQITILRSIADLQGSSVTDLFGSLTTLVASGNTLQGSANTLQASNNALIANSSTDLQVSANTLAASGNTLIGSTNTLLNSLIDMSYKSKGQFYTAANLTSNWSTIQVGFTAHSFMLTTTAAALGGFSLSYNGGTSVHGSVYPGETITFDGLESSTIALKCGSTANPVVRTWAWG
jgi:hypothetical protein